MNLDSFRNIPFRMQDLSSVYPDCVNMPAKAKRLERDGAITRLKKGMYVVSPRISGCELSPYLIANHLYGPSYVSMQSALRHYGLIPEAVFTIRSMTVGLSHEYQNRLGSFIYTHVPSDYYRIGIEMQNESGVTFLIASPEKALCDLMVYTPNLNLRFKSSILRYLEEDIRFDMDELPNLNIDIIERCATVSRKKTMLNRLSQLIRQTV